MTLKQRLAVQKFHPAWWAITINPFFFIRRSLLRKVAAIAPGLAGDILDLGCGSKPYEALFTSATHYVGVDVATSGHDHADSKVDIFYDGRVLPFGDASFDHVVSFETFEHIFNLDEVVAEAVRVIRPGGSLFISIPFGWDEHEKPYDFARYTSFGIAAILERHGLTIARLERINGFVEALCQLAMLYLHLILKSRFRLVNRISQLLIIFPFALISRVAIKLLPARTSFFSGLAVVARKPA
jgi:SAM-dependent methyltransferase